MIIHLKARSFTLFYASELVRIPLATTINEFDTPPLVYTKSEHFDGSSAWT
ncbi:putative kunitz-type protease inhibitor [Schistosoma mansoni]|uniref:putative kunitz-type protease inhibitor n=1 Tax=Schistosoma mansoni TaxID=6183 RepID=UPI00022DC16A|nr:putative kunitz-type protease inhibitor [Schistosoma mansoni]|eukprot:XP_018650115.1 putative kunitz-type protease inhibitor [Schistosoma mansoni]